MKGRICDIANQFFGNSLKARCARSSVVLAIGAFIAKFLGFGSKVVLTRLLVPQEMGLMVMILILTGLFESLTEIGIKQSVIQHKNGADPEYINMAWWFQGLRGMGLYVVAFMVAPWLCEFYFRSKTEVLARYSMEELITLVRVAFVSILFNGFISPRAHVLEKKFRFRRALVITQGSFVLGSIVTIVLAFVLRNVWAIVIGFASIGLFRCLMSYVLCPFIPRFAYHRDSCVGLCRFARGMLGLPILTYIAFSTDVLVAGKFISTSLVGLYGMARLLAFVPRDLFARTISPVLLSAFAKRQDNKDALCRAVLQMTKLTALFAIPPIVLAIICGKTILALVYGPRYSEVSGPFGLLCVYSLLLVQGNILASVFFGIGQPGKHRAFVGLRALVLAALIYPGIKFFGLTGAAAVIVLASFVAMCLQVTAIRRTIGLNIFDYVISWLSGLVLALPVLAIVEISRRLKPDLQMVHLVVGILSCIVVCLTGLLLPKLFDKAQRRKSVRATAVEFAGSEEAESA